MTDLETLRDELAAEQANFSDGSFSTSYGALEAGFKYGFDAAIKLLSESAGSFDAKQAEGWAPKGSTPHETGAFVHGARWMHDQMSARVGLLQCRVHRELHQRKEAEARLEESERDRDHWKGKFLIREGAKYRSLQIENRDLRNEIQRLRTPKPQAKGREFVICGITHKAFEILKGKMFIEFRGEPPKLPIYVSEVKEGVNSELPSFTVARNPSETWNE